MEVDAKGQYGGGGGDDVGGIACGDCGMVGGEVRND